MIIIFALEVAATLKFASFFEHCCFWSRFLIIWYAELFLGQFMYFSCDGVPWHIDDLFQYLVIFTVWMSLLLIIHGQTGDITEVICDSCATG